MTEFDMKAVKAEAEKAADENGMCHVVALIDGVKDNGHKYEKGQVFHMHKHLVPNHSKAGQVALADEKTIEKHHATKQQTTPANKQLAGSETK